MRIGVEPDKREQENEWSRLNHHVKFFHCVMYECETRFDVSTIAASTAPGALSQVP